ncbi:MAG: hypothetical protein IT423_22815 [Pirellulaceae bacterium]|nr:hypothetical protein [Pirellulaceae bacterium]
MAKHENMYVSLGELIQVVRSENYFIGKAIVELKGLGDLLGADRRIDRFCARQSKRQSQLAPPLATT